MQMEKKKKHLDVIFIRRSAKKNTDKLIPMYKRTSVMVVHSVIRVSEQNQIPLVCVCVCQYHMRQQGTVQNHSK